MSDISFVQQLVTDNNINSINTWSDFQTRSLEELNNSDSEVNRKMKTAINDIYLYDRSILNKSDTDYLVQWCKLYLEQAVKLARIGMYDQRCMPEFRIELDSEDKCSEIVSGLTTAFNDLGVNTTRDNCVCQYITKSESSINKGTCYVIFGTFDSQFP